MVNRNLIRELETGDDLDQEIDLAFANFRADLLITTDRPALELGDRQFEFGFEQTTGCAGAKKMM